MSTESSNARPARRNLDSLRKEAKQWLHLLQGAASDPATHAARERLARALQPAPEVATLRDVQHALARENGYAGWSDLKRALSPDAATGARVLQQYEEKAEALLEAYRTGTPEALERHYRFTWHRRAWPAMRSYVQLDLGKRPLHAGDDVAITLDDARYLVAIEHDFASWDAVRAFAEGLPRGFEMTASPVHVRASNADDAASIVSTPDWSRVLGVLRERPDAVLDANGQVTDALLEQLARVPDITVLRLGGCKALTDDGVRHLARLPALRVLDLSGTGVTDRGLAVVRELPALESLSLVMTRVTDAGMIHLAGCHGLRELNLMWTHTGDEAIRSLAGKERFTHLWSGNGVSDAGLARLHEVPVFRSWRGGEVQMGLLRNDVLPNQLSLRGVYTDKGLEALRGLDGLFGLELNENALSAGARALEPLASLPNLGKLGLDVTDAWMPVIARMPALRFLSMQDTAAGDDAFEVLSTSPTIEYLWGRRSYGLGSRGFRALRRMPRLRGLSMSCRNVEDDAIALLPEFPSLRELMPMDVPDAGYRHIGQCRQLEALLLMYCRDTTDLATEQITGLARLRRYFNSYTTITDRTPELLSGIASLEEVTFDACNGLTNAGVAALARLPRLRELRVSGNGLTPEVGKGFPAGVVVRYAR